MKQFMHQKVINHVNELTLRVDNDPSLSRCWVNVVLHCHSFFVLVSVNSLLSHTSFVYIRLYTVCLMVPSEVVCGIC